MPKKDAFNTQNTNKENSFKLQAKKSLGQNFLKNPTIIKKIAETGEIKAEELIIEIGGGTGELTAGLLTEIRKNPKAKLLVIEKDSRAIPILNQRFENDVKIGILEIIEGDFLEIDLKTYISGRTFKIIANIPYYITGAIVRKSLEISPKPAKLVFLVQKEVAQRIVEKDGKGSILSKSIAFYGKPKLIIPVAKGNFVPIPKVDSSVISIEIDQNRPKNIAETHFFDILHAGFAHKRKILASNIKEFIKKTKNTDKIMHKTETQQEKSETLDNSKSIEKIFEEIGLDPKIRAEELATNEWVELSKRI